MKTEDVRMLNKKRWAENFERLLNVEGIREAELVAAGREQGLHVLGELNDKEGSAGISKGDERKEMFEKWWSDCGCVVSKIVECMQFGAN